uniref:ShKT domain-containing protein n=1 Tax=Meloidogyne hapla TaxID=6305 RepID=A0A1I8B9X2_MELHA
MSFILLILQSVFLLKIAEGAQKCYFGDFVDGKVKECKESSWKCATLTCPGTVFRGCLSPNGVCNDLINLFTSCKDTPNPACFLCDGDLCNDNSTDTTNKKFEATSESVGATEERSVSEETSSSNPEENKTNQNATAEMLQSSAGNNTANGSSNNRNTKYITLSFMIALFVLTIF